jgi:hypothetical protein
MDRSLSPVWKKIKWNCVLLSDNELQKLAEVCAAT